MQKNSCIIDYSIFKYLMNKKLNTLFYINASRIKYFLCVAICIISFSSFAQTKEQLRYEIDAKRGGMSYTSKDALPRGREFKRLDSTYYVGWMFEGMYKFDHAADFIGFRVASDQLEKASILLEKDFKKQLRTRTSEVFEYIKMMNYHRDWDYISYALMQCYSNMDMPDKVWALLQRCKRNDLQDEVYLDTYNYLAWTVHRNRFYTNSKYSFLKKSINENEKYANKLLDSSALKIKRDALINKTIFSANYEKEKMPGVWHYKSILYSYQLNIESGAYYYEKLRDSGYFPENNFATFCAIQGKFIDAEQYYDIAKMQDQGDKRMKESFYYLSIINSYKNNNKAGILELKDLIKANGSTPGFGWYNLALTRDLMYDGQTEIAKRYAMRAEQFKEIHIGTTLGQSHYDFTVSLLNLILKEREIEQLKFLHNNWWYSPMLISKIAALTVEKYTLQFLIINQFASNPERDLVIYKLFSTESTVSFDEIWYLIDGFSTNYFLNKFEKEITQEKRYNIKRYDKLFVAKLLMKKGKYKEAKLKLESILNEILIDKEFEKLLLARVYEALAICKKELKENDMIDLKYCAEIYPQLLPFSGFQIPIRLHSNEKTEKEVNVIKAFKNANFKIVSDLSENAMDVNILFKQKGAISIIEYSSRWGGSEVCPTTQISFSDTKLIEKNLPFYIFNIGNDDKNIDLKKEK